MLPSSNKNAKRYRAPNDLDLVVLRWNEENINQAGPQPCLIRKKKSH